MRLLAKAQSDAQANAVKMKSAEEAGKRRHHLAANARGMPLCAYERAGTKEEEEKKENKTTLLLQRDVLEGQGNDKGAAGCSRVQHTAGSRVQHTAPLATSTLNCTTIDLRDTMTALPVGPVTQSPSSQTSTLTSTYLPTHCNATHLSTVTHLPSNRLTQSGSEMSLRALTTARLERAGSNSPSSRTSSVRSSRSATSRSGGGAGGGMERDISGWVLQMFVVCVYAGLFAVVYHGGGHGASTPAPKRATLGDRVGVLVGHMLVSTLSQISNGSRVEGIDTDTYRKTFVGRIMARLSLSKGPHTLHSTVHGVATTGRSPAFSAAHVVPSTSVKGGGGGGELRDAEEAKHEVEENKARDKRLKIEREATKKRAREELLEREREKEAQRREQKHRFQEETKRVREEETRREREERSKAHEESLRAREEQEKALKIERESTRERENTREIRRVEESRQEVRDTRARDAQPRAAGSDALDRDAPKNDAKNDKDVSDSMQQAPPKDTHTHTHTHTHPVDIGKQALKTVSTAASTTRNGAATVATAHSPAANGVQSDSGQGGELDDCRGGQVRIRKIQLPTKNFMSI